MCNNCSFLSPWIYVTDSCNCACSYCMVNKQNRGHMTTENFEKIMFVSEQLLENGDYCNFSFRISGGEPLLAFENYKDIVTKYKKRPEFNFGILTNGTIMTDEIIDWLKLNDVGIQVSLDDLHEQKPFAGSLKSSAPKVLENISWLRERGVGFSLNTTLDVGLTNSIKDLAAYVADLDVSWGLNASYLENDPSKNDQVLTIIKEALVELDKHNYDLFNKLRIYNMYLGNENSSCGAGASLVSITTDLDLYACQTQYPDTQKVLGKYDIAVKEHLMSEANKYYRDRTMMPECTDCSVLKWCRGGCRASHEYCKETTCVLKRELVNFIFDLTRNRKTPRTALADMIIAGMTAEDCEV